MCLHSKLAMSENEQWLSKCGISFKYCVTILNNLIKKRHISQTVHLDAYGYYAHMF